MHFAKNRLGDLQHCYAALIAKIRGRKTYFFAPDDVGPCLAIDAETLECTHVWEKPGGTMSILAPQGHDGEILASQNFMPGFRARDAAIVRARQESGAWEVHPWLKLPYVHRFDIIEHAGRTWFLGCILSGTDGQQADWEVPGSLVVAELNAQMLPPEKLTVIAGGMHKNHGYCQTRVQGEMWILTACEEGIDRIVPPERGQNQWRVSRLIETPASDVAACDLDGDGRAELIVISPFHGDRVEIYREREGMYHRVCEVAHHSRFLHAIWAGDLLGSRVALIGGRGGAKETLQIEFRDGAYHSQVIEAGMGASNFCVSGNGILVANRESGECALWTVLPD